MGIFSKKKPADTTTGTPELVKSDSSTPSQSEAPSVADAEKTEPESAAVPTAESRTSSRQDGQNNALEEKIEAIENDEEAEENRLSKIDTTTDYPHSTKLYLITIALMLAVFCMALDNTIIS